MLQLSLIPLNFVRPVTPSIFEDRRSFHVLCFGGGMLRTRAPPWTPNRRRINAQAITSLSVARSSSTNEIVRRRERAWRGTAVAAIAKRASVSVISEGEQWKCARGWTNSGIPLCGPSARYHWGHSPRKSICFSMCAVSAYWGHLTAKSSEISTNGLDCSESRRERPALR
jgi:hypothetical protein